MGDNSFMFKKVSLPLAMFTAFLFLSGCIVGSEEDIIILTAPRFLEIAYIPKTTPVEGKKQKITAWVLKPVENSKAKAITSLEAAENAESELKFETIAFGDYPVSDSKARIPLYDAARLIPPEDEDEEINPKSPRWVGKGNFFVKFSIVEYNDGKPDPETLREYLSNQWYEFVNITTRINYAGGATGFTKIEQQTAD
jgi:hypothetical protein